MGAEGKAGDQAKGDAVEVENALQIQCLWRGDPWQDIDQWMRVSICVTRSVGSFCDTLRGSKENDGVEVDGKLGISKAAVCVGSRLSVRTKP